jgi:hypothetical protein
LGFTAFNPTYALLDNAAHIVKQQAVINRQIVQAGEGIQAFERSGILTMRMARTSTGAYPRGLVNRLIRQKSLLFNNLQRVGQQTPSPLPYPSGLNNFMKTASFLGVATYGDAEPYPLVHQFVSP